MDNLTATPDPSNMWGILGLVLIFFLGIAFYLSVSYFYNEYKKATQPTVTVEEVKDDKSTV